MTSYIQKPKIRIFQQSLLALVLCLSFASTGLADIYKKPVVQKRILGPGEAVKEMARLRRERSDLLVDVNDEASREKELSGADPLPPGLMGSQEGFDDFTEEPPSLAKKKPSTSSEKPAAKVAQQRPQAISNQQKALASPPPRPQKKPATTAATRVASIAKVPAPQKAVAPQSVISQQLEALTQRRTAGEISGDTYLAERRRIIYGDIVRLTGSEEHAPKPARPSTEQQLKALTRRRVNGEISGEAYLVERRWIIHGQKR